MRLRKLVTTVLLMIPVLAFSAAAPTAGVSTGSTRAAASTAPLTCIFWHGTMYCY
jgi:hypothetical protein